MLVVLAILYGVCMEVIQSVFTQNRQADFYDVVANSSGAFFGILFANIFFKSKRDIWIYISVITSNNYYKKHPI